MSETIIEEIVRFAFFDETDNFICKKRGKVYTSSVDIENAIFYKNEKQANNMLRDIDYWKHRGIDITKFHVGKVTKKTTISCRRKGE